MAVSNIVVGQKVSGDKVVRAKELRSEMTTTEALLWNRLRKNLLGGLHFRRQQVIRGFIVDFYCHAAGLVVEVDGDTHDGREAYDEGRDDVLTGLGLRVMRIRNEEVQGDLEGVLKKITRACADPTPQPPSRRGKGEEEWPIPLSASERGTEGERFLGEETGK